MIVAVDIGNTKTAVGVFNEKVLSFEKRTLNSSIQRKNEIAVLLKQVCKDVRITITDITGVVIASVVPDRTDLWNAIIRDYLKLRPVVVSADLNLGITIHYNNPKSLGADRICNTVAAYEKFGGPAIVVDLGTATTYDVISKDGDFLGGVIAPGIETGSASLRTGTAQLPAVELRFPDIILGTNTVSSLQAGILFGALDAVEGTIRRLTSITGPDTIIVATGGLAHIITPRTNVFHHVEPSLVLEGACRIYQRVKQVK